MTLLQAPNDHLPARETTEVAPRLDIADDCFSRLLELFASVLDEDVEATEKLSARVSSLRREIAAFAPGRRHEERPQ
jgi:hypothetical protein